MPINWHKVYFTILKKPIFQEILFNKLFFEVIIRENKTLKKTTGMNAGYKTTLSHINKIFIVKNRERGMNILVAFIVNLLILI